RRWWTVVHLRMRAPAELYSVRVVSREPRGRGVEYRTRESDTGAALHSQSTRTPRHPTHGGAGSRTRCLRSSTDRTADSARPPAGYRPLQAPSGSRIPAHILSRLPPACFTGVSVILATRRRLLQPHPPRDYL